MTGEVSSLWRHPIKSHGREELDQVVLEAGKTMPWDRVWAVAHDASKADGSEWVSCANFSRVAKAPELMAITARFNETSGLITLSHPARDDLSFDPNTDATAFLSWVAPLVPRDRALPDRIISVPDRGMTDSDFPSVTLCNMVSHRAVAHRTGSDLSIHRWRGNIWFDGMPVWEEFDWIGKEVQIGEAVLKVIERTDRCMATTSNPVTGKRDVDTLAALDEWGHQDFSVRAEVLRGGRIEIGDKVTPL